MAKVSRLYRKLRACGITAASIFTVYLGGQGLLQSNEITSITIHRGKSQRGGGVDPSTIEVGTTRPPVQEASAKLITAELSDMAATELAAHLSDMSSVTAEDLKTRFHGRIGKVSVEDEAKRRLTTYMGASWITMLNYVGRKITPAKDQTLFSVIGNLGNYLDSPYGIEFLWRGTPDKLAAAQDPVRWSDGIGKYATDVGILVRANRNGKYEVQTIGYRKELADTLLPIRPPLTRSQAISPASWEQPNESVGVEITYFAVNAATGAPLQQLVGTEGGVERIREPLEIDWKYVATTPNGELYREALGQVQERNPINYGIPSITIDLLYLLTSDKPYHRWQAAHLLAMEVGDPVFFSGDWPGLVNGVQYAEGITETITPDKWELTLTLLSYQQVTGWAPSPTVPALVWESANYPWDNETRKWDEA